MGSCSSSPFDMRIGFLNSHLEELRWSLHDYYSKVIRICHCLFLLQPRRGHPETISFSADSTLKRYKSALERCTISINQELAILKRQHQLSNPTHNGSYARDPRNSAKREIDSKKHDEYLHTIAIQLNLNYMATWRGIRTIGSTSIFLLEPSYERFGDCDSSSSTLPYSGNAGAGKSVILANMVNDLEWGHLEHSHIVYFFCLQDEVNSLQALVILGAIYYQVLRRLLTGSRVSHVTKGLGVLSTILDNTVDVAFNLRIALEAAGMAFLVLDGLDQCQESEQTKVIEVLQCLQTQCSLSICLSTRPGVLTGIGWIDLHSIDIPTDNLNLILYRLRNITTPKQWKLENLRPCSGASS